LRRQLRVRRREASAASCVDKREVDRTAVMHLVYPNGIVLG